MNGLVSIWDLLRFIYRYRYSIWWVEFRLNVNCSIRPSKWHLCEYSVKQPFINQFCLFLNKYKKNYDLKSTEHLNKIEVFFSETNLWAKWLGENEHLTTSNPLNFIRKPSFMLLWSISRDSLIIIFIIIFRIILF